MRSLKFDTNAALDELKALVVAELPSYIASVEDLPAVMGVYISQDYSDSRKEKPYINIYPSQAQPSEGGQCMVGKVLTVEISVFVASKDEIKAEKNMISYADCIESLFSDFTETESLFDITGGTSEYWTNASTMEKMASIVIECTTRPASR